MKMLSGHALGAAGVHEAIYSLIMLNRFFLAKSANINDLVEEAEGMNILLDRHDGEVTVSCPIHLVSAAPMRA